MKKTITRIAGSVARHATRMAVARHATRMAVAHRATRMAVAHRATRMGFALWLCAVALATTFTGCSNDDNILTEQHGFVSVTTDIDPTFVFADGSRYTLDDSQVPDNGDLSMTIAMTGNSQYAHTWDRMDDFDSRKSLMCGDYSVTVQGRRDDTSPRMGGHDDFAVQPAVRTLVNVHVAPLDALVLCDIDNSQADGVAIADVMVHTTGAEYTTATAGAGQQRLFVAAGQQNYYATLTRADGRSIVLAMPQTTGLDAAHGQRVSASVKDGTLIFDAGTQTGLAIDNDLFDAEGPRVTVTGFTPGQTLTVNEGVTLTQPIAMTVSSPRRLQHVYQSVTSPILSGTDMPTELDLLNLTPQQQQLLHDNGLEFTVSADGCSMTVTYNRVLETMASLTTSDSQFALLAQDIAGLCSQPTTLTVSTRVLQFTLGDVSAAILGDDTATMTIIANMGLIERDDFSIYCLDADGNPTDRCDILDFKAGAGNDVVVTFAVPQGDKPLDIAVDYLGLRRATAVVQRQCPPFTLQADAYANSAILAVASDTPQRTAAVVKYAVLTVDSQRASVWNRYDDRGLILINGLQPQTTYEVQATVAGTGTATAQLRTEQALPVPMADFNDWKVLYDVKHLPQGGRYSATSLTIVNRQNYQDVYVQWPKKHWASINGKTFDESSANRNTWYMQPSTVIEAGPDGGDAKAMRLTSVGWDHNGPVIPDYVQLPGQSLPYNNNVPAVAHRSAGRLWLGAYDAARDSMVQDAPFTSRPSSLNGYFKYLPDLTVNTDRGYVEIEIVNRAADGTETVIASGRQEFQTTPDYKAFSVPLTYNYFNMPATGLRMMFASSVETGSQEHEDRHVPVTAMPEYGAMIGSTLWITGLTFSY